MTNPSAPRVSVVMAVHNAAGFLREAIESVLAQTYTDFELVIVDDCSSDTSVEIVKSFADARIRLLEHSLNQGAATSRNHAIADSRGGFIAVMDADDLCAPQRLARQMECFDRDPRLGVVGCGVFDNIDDRGHVLYRSTLPQSNGELQRTIVRRWCFLHPSLMFQKRLLAQTGGAYRPAFAVAEDHDLILRLMEHAEAYNIPEPLMRYRINPKGLSVQGHRYINASGEVAIQLAKRRRSGMPEDFAAATRVLQELKVTKYASPAQVSEWLNSLYAANRYYGFGCREFCDGRLANARRCYRRAIATNPLFLRSWIGIAFSCLPSVLARQVRPLFQTSMQQRQESMTGAQCAAA